MGSKLTYEERQKLSKSLYKVHKRIFKGPNEKEFDHYVVNSPANVTKIFIYRNQPYYQSYLEYALVIYEALTTPS